MKGLFNLLGLVLGITILVLLSMIFPWVWTIVIVFLLLKLLYKEEPKKIHKVKDFHVGHRGH